MCTLVGGMCSMCCHMALVLAFLHLYSIFILRLFVSIFYQHFFSGFETSDRNGEWYQHLLTIYVLFYESNTEGTNIRMRMFYIVFNLCDV